MKRRLILLGALAAVLLGWSPAMATFPKLQVSTILPAGDTAVDLAVTPDNRYVVVLGETTGTLRFIDTWDFTVLDGSTDSPSVLGGSTPTCLAVSPYSDYVYVGLQNGHVLYVNLARYNGILPYENLRQNPAMGDVDASAVSSSAIDFLTAIPDVNGVAGYVYLLAAADDGLHWAELSGANTVSRSGTITPPQTRTSLGLDRGNKYGFDLYSILPGPTSNLRPVSCNQTLGTPCAAAGSIYTLSVGADVLTGLAADPVDDRMALTLDLTSQDLYSLDTKPVNSIYLYDGFTVTLPSPETAFFSDGDEAAVLAWGATISVVGIEGDTASFTGASESLVVTGADFNQLAASDDGSVYVAGAGGEIFIATNNPWIENLMVAGGSTVSGDTTTVSFKAYSRRTGTFHYALYNNETFGNWTNLIGSGTFNLSGSSVSSSFITSTNGLGEAQTNLFTLIVTDPDGHKGRQAVAGYVDTPPKAPDFQLNFDDRKLVVDISGVPDGDLARYEVYYGTNGGSTVDYTGLNGATSPVVVSSPAANQDYSVTIKNLTNGVRYWVQVVAVAQAGQVGVGARKSGVPQPIVTLADLTDEEGGVNCLGSVSSRGGNPVSAAELLFPLLLLGLYRVWQRRQG